MFREYRTPALVVYVLSKYLTSESSLSTVALNYQSEGRVMQLNDAKFRVNGNCGYVLKPQQMCKGNVPLCIYYCRHQAFQKASPW